MEIVSKGLVGVRLLCFNDIWLDCPEMNFVFSKSLYFGCSCGQVLPQRTSCTAPSPVCTPEGERLENVCGGDVKK